MFNEWTDLTVATGANASNLPIVTSYFGQVTLKANGIRIEATKIGFYVCTMFAQVFCSFILKHGPTFMAKADRDTICGMTIQEKLNPPTTSVNVSPR